MLAVEIAVVAPSISMRKLVGSSKNGVSPWRVGCIRPYSSRISSTTSGSNIMCTLRMCTRGYPPPSAAAGGRRCSARAAAAGGGAPCRQPTASSAASSPASTPAVTRAGRGRRREHAPPGHQAAASAGAAAAASRGGMGARRKQEESQRRPLQAATPGCGSVRNCWTVLAIQPGHDPPLDDDPWVSYPRSIADLSALSRRGQRGHTTAGLVSARAIPCCLLPAPDDAGPRSRLPFTGGTMKTRLAASLPSLLVILVAALVAAGCAHRPVAPSWKYADFKEVGFDPFPGMDFQGRDVKLSDDDVKGRVIWNLWTGDNAAFWDWLSTHGFGTADLLKVVTSPRDKRFEKYGLFNQPGFMRPAQPDAYGLYVDVPREARYDLDARIDLRTYGRSSGIMGLRLFPNT